jgi:hypothetical protein
MSRVGREFIYAVNFVRQLSLSFQWWFPSLESLSFSWRFLVSRETVFAVDSMRQRWLYFLYWFHASTVNQFSLSISCVIRHSIFNDDFSFYSDSIFADDFCISIDIVFLTIPCIAPNYILGIDVRRRSGIHWRCQFRTLVVTQCKVSISSLQRLSFRWRFMDQQWHSIFDTSMRQPWLYFCYRFDVSVGNSLTLSLLYASCHSVFIDDF